MPLLLSRRTFVTWLGSIAAAAGLGARAKASTPLPTHDSGGAPPSLDLAVLTKIGEIVLPTELGTDGISRVAHAFGSWIDGYRPGAELVHPYGSATLRFTGESPVSRWQQQVAALQQAARSAHARPFEALTRDQRESLVRAAMTTDRADRLGDPLTARHVAVALMAYFYNSSEATDRCYQVQIGRNSCRPLVNSARQPLPLPGRRGT